MRAMVLDRVGGPLMLVEREAPIPGPRQVLLRVETCGVCRTDLHLLDGEVRLPALPRVLGHQIVGRVVGDGGARPSGLCGVPWLAWACGVCDHCRRGLENLCERARFTGCDVDGGFAEFVVVEEAFCVPIPADLDPVRAAPLLCAGAIGLRSLRMCGDAARVGIFGFGSAGHIVAQIAMFEGRSVLAFTRPGDAAGQRFARDVGAGWAGGSDEAPTEPLDAAIVFAPVGSLVPAALRLLRPGGVVVCAGIHMSAIPSFDYELLWNERSVRSVANVTRADVADVLGLATRIPVDPTVTTYPLLDAAAALEDLRAGRYKGSAVLVV